MTILLWALFPEHMAWKSTVKSVYFPLRSPVFYVEQGSLTYALLGFLLHTYSVLIMLRAADGRSIWGEDSTRMHWIFYGTYSVRHLTCWVSHLPPPPPLPSTHGQILLERKDGLKVFVFLAFFLLFFTFLSIPVWQRFKENTLKLLCLRVSFPGSSLISEGMKVSGRIVCKSQLIRGPSSLMYLYRLWKVDILFMTTEYTSRKFLFFPTLIGMINFFNLLALCFFLTGQVAQTLDLKRQLVWGMELFSVTGH